MDKVQKGRPEQYMQKRNEMCGAVVCAWVWVWTGGRLTSGHAVQRELSELNRCGGKAKANKQTPELPPVSSQEMEVILIVTILVFFLYI